MTLGTIGGIFLWTGFVLQLVLLVVLFMRRLASQVALFTALIAFYAVRSVLLFAFFQPFSRAHYVDLVNALSWLDVALQLALVVEISVLLLRRDEASSRLRLLSLPVLFVVAAAFTAALTFFLPARSPVPADRGVLFTGALFGELFAWSLTVRLTALKRSMIAGLAGLGLAGVLSQSFKSVAAFHRAARPFVAWSYFDAAVYLLVLIFWISRAVDRRPFALHIETTASPSAAR